MTHGRLLVLAGGCLLGHAVGTPGPDIGLILAGAALAVAGMDLERGGRA